MNDKLFYVLWSIMIFTLNIYFVDNSELINYLKKWKFHFKFSNNFFNIANII